MKNRSMPPLASVCLGGILASLILAGTGCNPAKKPLPGPPPAPEAERAPAPKPDEGKAMTPAPAAPPTPPTAPAAPAYPTAESLLNALVAKLRAADLPGFFALAGSGVSPAEQRKINTLLGERKFQPSATKPPAEAAPGSYTVFLDSPADLAAAGPQSLKLTFSNDPVKGWAVASVSAPAIEVILAAKTAAEKKPEPAPAPTPPPPPTPAPVAKGPVDFARDFLNAVVARDFRSAKLAVDAKKLTDEKLAALFIVVEEGAFKPHDRNPLIGTAAGTDSAWVIARLKSEKQESDFGMEMKLSGEGASAAWKVVGLNFSKLIQTAAAQAGAGDIAYAPIKTDLQDGDQLVLYFDYDNARVNPRAAKQLRIIADILRDDPKKMIHINGHADALGTADYNEALSDSRAAAVRQILLAHGIPAGQVVTKAFGFSAPKAPNVNPDGTDNPTGRAQNRRAEVYLAF